ncbi:uncharacterized protein LOC115734374 [Rhodamnia argentea]|uniref:Uncharacterized protein LOC115734374 n=1 Tax=Rhodamnia argentea TaxID=178133 RepID=A0ABM3HJ97_9MYRT|nr:uncharacterized protein LOC115734374 [Rhodamnia argentea]
MAEAVATSAAESLVSKLVEYLITPIGRQFGYVLCYKSYVEDLQNGVQQLKAARERVHSSVEEAEYDGKLIHTDVENWLKSVKEEIEKADNLLKRGARANNACFHGWLPNPVVRHPIGRKVKKMTPVIRGLHEESAKSNFQKVYYENTPIGIITATTSAARPVDKKEDVLDSRASITEYVMKAMADDKVRVIGVWGPGGVGKSKLLEDVERRVKQEKLFDVIAVANVLRNPDLKRIQEEIANALGLKLTNDESPPGRADRLSKRLERDPKKKILIILDNLWEKLELKEVGIPCGDDNRARGCKLLLTSRNRDVLRIGMSVDREKRLNELEDGEDRKLFERMVGDKVNEPDFKPWVDGVVKNCGGLPLLLVSLAKRLKHGDLAAWRNASTNIDVSDVKSIVELSYNDLKEERIRSLFLVCALDSGKSFLRDSLLYCMGLGLYEKFNTTIENARDRLIVDLHCLQDSSLLLESDDMEEFRMHDKFVDVAISMSSTDWYALVGKKDYGFKKWSKDELRKCTAISFNFVGIDEIPDNLDCPSLRILLLCEHSPSLKIPKSFFESMEKLQVLDISGLSFTSLPSSMELLGNLKSLSLDQCCLEDVTALGKLKGLQFLSFLDSTITCLPKAIGELTELRSLDLRSCTRLEVIEPGVLASLVNLEELYMEDSFDRWEVEDEAPRSNASLAELKNMKKLSTLSISIPHSAFLPRDLPFGKLNKHKIQIGNVWDWSGECKESKSLKLKLDSSNLLVEEWVSKCLQRTQDLHLDGLQDGINNIHDLCDEGFQELKHLHVQNSPSFHYVVRSTENVQCTAFTRLESLFLENLDNLEKICSGYLALESFTKLNILKVDNCGKIKHLVPLPMKRIMLQLEEIEISRCHLMQHIVLDAEADEDRDEIYDDNKGKSYNLRRLTLRNLPKMTSFCKTESHSINFFDGQQLIKLQSLESITIGSCQLIGEVFDLEGLTTSGEVEILSQLRELTLIDLPSLGRIWNKNPRRLLSFQNLRALKVQNCENLRFLFSSSMAKALRQIKEIEIADCKLMEEIMDVQEEELEEAATFDTIEFPMLTSLSLEELPNLKTFYTGKYHIHCPSLTSPRISGCPKMMTFSSYKGKQWSMSTDTGLPQVFCCTNSGLPLPVFFNEKVLFPSLEELKLSSMCELRRIWHDQLHGQSFGKLASLTVELCENLSHLLPSNSMDWLQSLNKLKVVGCPSLEELFGPVSLNAEKRQKPLVLSVLKKVKLLNLPKLKDIVKSDCKITLAFPSLIKVKVRRCHSLPYLFSTATAKTLDELEVLDVSCCDNLRSIIVMEEGKGKIIETLKFRHLSTLKLGDLENLISFSSASCAGEGLHPLFDEKLVFPKLEELQIKGIQLKELWHNKILAESFCRLKVLEVKQCHNLLNVIPSFMWKRLLRCVESLTVESCNLIEDINTLEGLGFMEREAARNSPLRQLSLCDLPNLTRIWKNEDLLNLCFHNLTSIRVEECPRITKLFTMCMAASLGQLQHLVLGGCGEMEYVVAREEEKPKEVAHKIVIPQLVTMYLHNMPKLISFCQGKHISEWPSLKEFTVEDCRAVEVIIGDASCRKPEGNVAAQQPLLLVEKVIPQLELLTLAREDVVMMPQHYIFGNLRELILGCYHDENAAFPSNFLLHRFPNLEMLFVSCSSFKEIFPEDAIGHGGGSLKALGNLKQLRLVNLCNLRRVWKDGSLMDEILKQIEDLFLAQCPSLSIVFPTPTSFHSLTELEVADCNGLVHVGTCSAVTSLVHLTRLILRNCAKMEVVVTDDGNGADEISFPNLEVLILDRLPSLESFSPMNCVFTFPSLQSIVVMQCPQMDIFCKGALRTPKLDEVLLSEEDDEGHWEGDLNTTIQTLWRQTDSEVLSDDDDEEGPSEDDLDPTIQSFEA